MELSKQKQGTPKKQKYSTSKEGIGNTGFSVYEEIMAPKVIRAEHEECNHLPISRPTVESGKKLSIQPLSNKRI